MKLYTGVIIGTGIIGGEVEVEVEADMNVNDMSGTGIIVTEAGLAVEAAVWVLVTAGNVEEANMMMRGVDVAGLMEGTSLIS